MTDQPNTVSVKVGTLTQEDLNQVFAHLPEDKGSAWLDWTDLNGMARMRAMVSAPNPRGPGECQMLIEIVANAPGSHRTVMFVTRDDRGTWVPLWTGFLPMDMPSPYDRAMAAAKAQAAEKAARN